MISISIDNNSEGKEQPKKPLDGKGNIDLTYPDALIAEALGLARYQDVVNDSTGVLSKLSLFGGPVDASSWEEIQNYIASGSKGSLDTRSQHYLDILTLIHALDTRYGKRNTIRFLVSPYFQFSYEQAARLWGESVEMFYANRNVSRDAMRAKTADMLDAAYTAAFNAATTAKDFKNAAEILKMKAEVLGLNREDPVVLDIRTYQRPFRVLSLEPESIGLVPANRRELGQIIDSLKLPAGPDRRIRMESGIIDFDITEILNNESQEAD